MEMAELFETIRQQKFNVYKEKVLMNDGFGQITFMWHMIPSQTVTEQQRILNRGRI